MVAIIETALESAGCRCRVVPASRIEDLRQSLRRFAETEELNGFQRFVVDQLYRYEEDTGFAPASIVIAAAPSPAYAAVTFAYRGKTVSARCLHPARIGDEAADAALLRILRGALAPHGYHAAPAPALPFKRLAAMSGLAAYGRNNITYVEGFGSFFNYAAFFTDVPCEDARWTEPRMADACANCHACAAACPTEAIPRDRFLINTDRCLSFINEGPGEFPEWVPKDAHHTLYDCLRCQMICPMNRAAIQNVAGPFAFDENETEMLLGGAELTEYSPECRAKIERLGIDKWPAGVPRNLRAILE